MANICSKLIISSSWNSQSLVLDNSTCISDSLDVSRNDCRYFDEGYINTTPTATMDDKSEAQKKRFRKLFDKLDINKDGRIEASELAVALRASSTAISEADVKVFAKVRSLPACVVVWGCIAIGDGPR